MHTPEDWDICSSDNIMKKIWHQTLKRTGCHFDEIFITGCTERCHFANFQCSQWWGFVSIKVPFQYRTSFPENGIPVTLLFKTAVSLLYFHNGKSYIGKSTSLINFLSVTIMSPKRRWYRWIFNVCFHIVVFRHKHLVKVRRSTSVWQSL